MTAAIAFILFVVSGGAAPDLTSLSVYASKEACEAAATSINETLAKGEDGKKVLCLSTDSLTALAVANGLK